MKSSVLITVHSAYLPALAVFEAVSTTTKVPLGVVTSSIQSDWLVNVVNWVVEVYVPLPTVV